MKSFTITRNSPERNLTRSKRNSLFLRSFVLVLSFLTLSVGSTWAQCTPAQVDALFSVNIDGLPGDWNSLHNAEPPALTYSHIIDPFGSGVVDDQFTQGSKDFDFIADQRWANGQTKNKNDIANAAGFLESKQCGDKKYTRLFFAGDRLSTNGTSQIGMWFYQGGVAPIEGTNLFEGEHVGGDILALINFVDGGSTAEVEVYSWNDKGTGEYGNGNLDLEITGVHRAVQIQVGDNVPEGWPFPAAQYEENQFFEGFIDIGILMADNPEIDACFNRFLIEGRSSQTLNAALDDFASGELNIKPTVTVDSDAVCDGETATLTATPGSGSASDYIFHWKDPEGVDIEDDDESIDVTVAGDYTVTISYKDFEIDCESEEATGTVTVYDLPDLTIGSTNVTCYNDGDGTVTVPENDYSLVLYMSDTENGTYVIVETPDTDEDGNFIDLGPGWYYVEATESHAQEEGDPVECTADSNKVEITQPDEVSVSASGSNATCYGDLGYLSVTASGYDRLELWSSADGSEGSYTQVVADVTLVDGKIEDLGAGYYIVKAFADGGNEEEDACTDESDAVQIVVPDEVSVSASGTNATCYGDLGYLSVTASGYDRLELWSSADGSEGSYTQVDADVTLVDGKISDLGAGYYIVKAFADGGNEEEDACTDESDAVQIVVPDEVSVSASGTNSTCYGDLGYLSVTASGYDRLELWSSADGSEGSYTQVDADVTLVDGKISDLGAGYYIVKAFADGGNEEEDACTDESEAVQIIVPDEVLVAGTGFDPTCENLSGGYIDVTASGYDRLELWKDGVDTGLRDSNLVSGSFTGLSAGSYVIYAFADGGNGEEDACTAETDPIVLTEPVCEMEACTLGYWKEHTDRWCKDGNGEFIYETCTPYYDVFGVYFPGDNDLTLLEALNLGGGGIYNLARQSVAALLNICHDNVSYPYSGGLEQLILDVQEAFAQGTEGALAGELDMINNMYPCPMDGSSATTASTCSEEESSASVQSVSSESVVKGDVILYPVPFSDVLNIEYDFDYTSDVVIEVYAGTTLLRSFTDENVTKGSTTQLNMSFANVNQLYVIRVVTSREVISKQASKQ